MSASQTVAGGSAPHVYSLSKQGKGFFTALAVSLRVFPYALFRFAHWSLFALLSALLLGAVIALGIALRGVHETAGIVAIGLGVVAFALLWWPYMQKKTFGTKCGHLALLTELVIKGALPKGTSQFELAKRMVDERLEDLDTVWSMRATLFGAMYNVTYTLRKAESFSNQIAGLRQVISQIMAQIANYLTDVVTSYGIARGDKDFRQAGRDGGAYCLQNVGVFSRLGIKIVVVDFLLSLPVRVGAFLLSTFAVFSLVYATQGGDLSTLDLARLSRTLGEDLGSFIIAAVAGLVGGVLIGMLITKTVREAFIQPVLTTMAMLAFHQTIQGQPLRQESLDALDKANSGLKSARRFAWRAS